MERNSVCPNCTKPLQGAKLPATCDACGANWVHEDVLRGCIRVFLAERHLKATIISFHERPAAESKFQCSKCRRSLAHVSLRGVDAYRCQECSFILLKPGA